MECAKVRDHLSYILLYLNICLLVVRRYVILGTHPPPLRVLIAKNAPVRDLPNLARWIYNNRTGIRTHPRPTNTSPVLLHPPHSW